MLIFGSVINVSVNTFYPSYLANDSSYVISECQSRWRDHHNQITGRPFLYIYQSPIRLTDLIQPDILISTSRENLTFLQSPETFQEYYSSLR